MKFHKTTNYPIRRDVRGAFPMVLLAFIPLGIALIAGHFNDDRPAPRSRAVAEHEDYRRAATMQQQALEQLMRLKAEARAREERQRRDAEAASRAAAGIKPPALPPVPPAPHPYLDRQTVAPVRTPPARVAAPRTGEVSLLGVR